MKKRNLFKQVLISSLMLASVIYLAGSVQEKVLTGEFWRKQALNDIIPYWYKHAQEKEHGGFYLALSREWKPIPPWEKSPPMISRDVYGFCAAFLLSGGERYWTAARQGVDFLLNHAWDKEYGGWFDSLTISGEPKDETKTVPFQLYTDVGLALYYFVTGEERALSHILQSIHLRKNRAQDKEHGGYFQALNRDLSVKDPSKSKHSHYGYTSSLLINLSMFTRDPEILSFAEELMEISIERMTDRDYGWLFGFPTAESRDWKYIPTFVDGKEIISAGAQLTAALSFLRLYELTGKEMYRERGVALGDQVRRFAWDSDSGGWHDLIERASPHSLVGPRNVSWWIQCYGDFLQLHLYIITRNRKYLDDFQKMAVFWNDHFIDRKNGGVFQTVSPDGSPVEMNKAVPWKAAYHEMEHGLLNYIYLKLYVEKQPIKLYFRLGETKANTTHFVSLIEDPSVQIESVKINGKPWTAFNARERSVLLPEGKNLNLEVTLAPGSLDIPSGRRPPD